MTVKELITELQKMPQEYTVMVIDNDGDYIELDKEDISKQFGCEEVILG